MSVSFSTIIQKARASPNHATSAAMRDAINKIAPTTYSALGNGFRVAAEENPNAQFATVGVWMDAGSKYETRGKDEGAAKMLELCGLQGTTNQSKTQISRALDELGGHLHLETQNEHKYLYIKCAKDNVPKAVSFLADIVNNARLADEDIAASRLQMVAGRRTIEENPDKLVFQNLDVCAYDSTEQGLGNTPFSTESAVKDLNRASLESFRAANHVGPKMVLVGAGAVNHTQLDKLAQEHFGHLPNTPALASKVESRYVGGDYRLWNLRYKTCHIAWGFETCGAQCADVVPLTLATQVHGSFHRSQGEMGQHAIHRVMKTYSSLDHGTPTTTHFPEQAVEQANSYIKTYADNGLCGMYIVGRPWKTEAGHAADSMLELLQYSLFDWARMAQKGIHQQEIEQAKVNYKAQLLFNMDGSTNTVEDIGRQVLHLNRRVPLTEMYARIDDVTPTNVQEVLQHYFYARKPVVSMTGQLYILPAYDWLTQMTWKFFSMA